MAAGLVNRCPVQVTTHELPDWLEDMARLAQDGTTLQVARPAQLGAMLAVGNELMLVPTSNVAILGFGKRAATFAALLAPRGCALRAWDPQVGGADGQVHRARIEAAGVDVHTELPIALRGARLVVLDTVPFTELLRAQLQDGQQLLDLETAPAAQIDAALAALGLPPSAARWEAACAAQSSPDISAVARGELP